MADRVLVTGGLGFIGSAFVRRAVQRGQEVVNIDLNTYAGDPRRILGFDSSSSWTKVADVADPSLVDLVIAAKPEVLVHFAAETHVTRGEHAEEIFFRTNVQGTRVVMEAARQAEVRLVLHVSTDEVYGPCSGAPFREGDKQSGEGLATSAYARSKALADDIARSFNDRLPVITVRPSNCFGPWQHPEKAVARWTARALTGQPIPVWGSGSQRRDWLYVDDACSGIETIIERGELGDVYNLAPQEGEWTNIEVAQMVAEAAGLSKEEVYLTAYDRPGHDQRYAINATKIRNMGWEPQAPFAERLAETVDWYRAHSDWWSPLVSVAEALYADETRRWVDDGTTHSGSHADRAEGSSG